MKIRFFITEGMESDLYPLTLSRPVSDLRVGGLTLAEKWLSRFNFTPSSIDMDSESSLKGSAYREEDKGPVLFIRANLIANDELSKQINEMPLGTELKCTEGRLLAVKYSGHGEALATIVYRGEPILLLTRSWQIFGLLSEEIPKDIKLLNSRNKQDFSIPDHVTLIGPRENLFISRDAKITASIINVSTGPVYLASGSEVMEGSMIRGPFYLGEESTVKMGAKIYGATAIGPHCKIGGELNNVQFWGYSNKAHDGFLGNSVIGAWCNLGADCNNSNLKNNYTEVKMWHYGSRRFESTGLQFCGLVMGDHSKAGINTMFNTGTVVGFSCNIFGSGFPRNFIPSFSWGGSSGIVSYELDAALDTAERVMMRREIHLSFSEREVFTRIWEKKALC
jgi:UDP-N-acetylglucosamine diphosphorylase/glucosamine-1-phosphate N-acetyltransferase